MHFYDQANKCVPKLFLVFLKKLLLLQKIIEKILSFDYDILLIIQDMQFQLHLDFHEKLVQNTLLNHPYFIKYKF